jgi:hypothetical protein
MSTKDTSNTTRLRRKMAEIYSSYYYNSINAGGALTSTRKEQTSQSSGEVTILRQQGCAPCRADNQANPPSNERVPGGR